MWLSEYSLQMPFMSELSEPVMLRLPLIVEPWFADWKWPLLTYTLPSMVEPKTLRVPSTVTLPVTSPANLQYASFGTSRAPLTVCQPLVLTQSPPLLSPLPPQTVGFGAADPAPATIAVIAAN